RYPEKFLPMVHLVLTLRFFRIKRLTKPIGKN
ncbi:MAG: hypothetical protein ACI86H_002889, partial [bacterium]